MSCRIPACVTKTVHVSIRNINVPAKLVGFSFLWVYMGSSRWERNWMADLSSCCILRCLAPYIMWWWAPEESCGGGRGPGGGGKWGWEALHPSLSGLHTTAPIILLWEGWGWRAGGCTGAVPQHCLWVTPGCLSPHTFVPGCLNFGGIGVDVCGVIYIAPWVPVLPFSSVISLCTFSQQTACLHCNCFLSKMLIYLSLEW